MFTRVRAFVAAAVMAVTAASAQPLRLPPIEGELSGEFAATLIPGAPPLHWRLVSERASDERRRISLVVEGDGTRCRIAVDVDLRTGNGTWEIADAVLDAKVWLGPLGNHLGGALAGIVGAGETTVAGRGTLRPNSVAGTVVIRSRLDVENAAGEWSLAGVTSNAELEFDTATRVCRSVAPATLEVKTITTSRFGARNLSIVGNLQDLTTFMLTSAFIEIAGGEAVTAPAVIPLAPLRLELDVRFVRVGLQDIVALAPELLAEARGRVNGQVHLRWSDRDGFELGNGSISLRQDEPAEVRLPLTPGLITDRLPPRVLKQLPGLELIEKGKMPLRASLLEVRVTPQGDESGRTAYVHLVGGPLDPNLKAPIDLELNIRGPLNQLLKFGTDSRIRFGNP